MRILAGLVPVIFLLALLPPAAVLADNEIVLDDESPAVQMTGGVGNHRGDEWLRRFWLSLPCGWRRQQYRGVAVQRTVR